MEDEEPFDPLVESIEKLEAQLGHTGTDLDETSNSEDLIKQGTNTLEGDLLGLSIDSSNVTATVPDSVVTGVPTTTMGDDVDLLSLNEPSQSTEPHAAASSTPISISVGVVTETTGMDIEGIIKRVASSISTQSSEPEEMKSPENARSSSRGPSKSILRDGPQEEYKASHERHVDWSLPAPSQKAKTPNSRVYRCGNKGSKRLITVAELKVMYMDKCRSLESRPLRKIMEQLENAITNGTQLRHINLADTPRITYSDWESVSEILGQNGFLLSLVCTKSSLNDMSLAKVTKALSKLRSFESLKLAYNPGIKGPGIASIGTLMSHCRRIKNLDLTGIVFDRKMAQNLAKSLHTATIVSLSLVECGLKDSSVAETIFFGCGKAPSLKSLELMGNGITGDSMAALGAALKQPSCAIQHLDMRSNAIGDNGARSLARALQKNNVLKDVVLWRNQIKGAGCCYLAQALKENTGLVSLDVSYNECASEQAMTDLRDLLLVNQTVKKISLVFTGLDGTGVIALSEALSINSTLELLDIRFNAVNTAGFMALASTVRMNTSLTEIFTDLATSKTDDELLAQVQVTIDKQCKENLQSKPNISEEITLSDLGTRYKDTDDPHSRKKSRVQFDVESTYKRLNNFGELLVDVPSNELESNESVQELLNHLLRAQPDLLSSIEEEKDDRQLSEYLLLNSRIVGILQQYDHILEELQASKASNSLIDFSNKSFAARAKGMLTSSRTEQTPEKR